LLLLYVSHSVVQVLLADKYHKLFLLICPVVGPRAILPYPFLSPPSALSFSIFYFFLVVFITRFIYSLALLSLHILPEYSGSRLDVV